MFEPRKRYTVAKFQVEADRTFSGRIDSWPRGIFVRTYLDEDNVSVRTFIIRTNHYGNFERIHPTSEWRECPDGAMTTQEYVQINGTVRFDEVSNNGHVINFTKES